jgi:tetratricopeptide (TPR) repeat protein
MIVGVSGSSLIDTPALTAALVLLGGPMGTSSRTRLCGAKGDGIYDDSDTGTGTELLLSLQTFKACAQQGMEQFMAGNLTSAIQYFDAAVAANSSQPLTQRGIALYCLGDYEEAQKQLASDIAQVEKMRMFKATDLRLWRYAALRKLSKPAEEAIVALDLHSPSSGLFEHRPLLNSTLLFYGNERTLEEQLEFVGATDPNDKDMFGIRFFGNFYLGLYYDAIGEPGLAQAFLTIPYTSNRYPARDMWYHIPRILYEQRFGVSSGELLNQDGFIL